MVARPTSRSKLLGAYLQFKGIEWAVLGFVVWWAALDLPELWKQSSLRLFAYYLLVFAVPGVLLWTLGVVVKYRHRMGWYGAVAYLASVMTGKIGGGIAELPVGAWQWASHQTAPGYLTGFKIFGLLSAVIFAMDLAALLAFLSPRGRDCYGIGQPNPEARP